MMPYQLLVIDVLGAVRSRGAPVPNTNYTYAPAAGGRVGTDEARTLITHTHAWRVSLKRRVSERRRHPDPPGFTNPTSGVLARRHLM